METCLSIIQHVENLTWKRAIAVFDNLKKNNLWKRVIKNVAATTIAVSICLIPSSSTTIGRAAYLSAIATVFGHPGRRFGQVAEALILILCGTLLGLGWSLLGLYLASLVFDSNPPAAYAIRGVFLVIALHFHGFLRSKTPRLFVFVLILIIVSVVSLTTTATIVTRVSATNVLYPLFLGVAVNLVVNLCVFPEFSSSFLGQTAIETLHEARSALSDAGHYFTALHNSERNPGGETTQLNQTRGVETTHKHQLHKVEDFRDGSCSSIGHLFNALRSRANRRHTQASQQSSHEVRLTDLTGVKAKLRAKLASCKAAQSECNFELFYGVFPPQDLKAISTRSMKKLVANTVAVIGACESKFALVGDDKDDRGEEAEMSSCNQGSDQKRKQSHFSVNFLTDPYKWSPKSGKSTAALDLGDSTDEAEKQEKIEIDLIKPRREIEFGDVRLLRYLLERIAGPYNSFAASIDRAVDCVTACVAYSYGVTNLPSNTRTPRGIAREEIDIYVEEIRQALTKFDNESMSALEGAAELQEREGQQPDVMPREEIFLIASFLLNLRQAAGHILDMLQHSRALVIQNQERQSRRKLYAPRIKWSKWLYSGGEEDESMPANVRKEQRQGLRNEQAASDRNADYAESAESLLASKQASDVEKDAGLPARLHKSQTPLPTSSQAQTDSRHHPHSKYSLQFRGRFADALEWAQSSDDLLYAFKLAIGVILVTWPAFVSDWNKWYSLNRGLWAALQLVFITEVSIGTSVMTFFLRGIGTTLGCLWGWAAVEARDQNRIVIAVLICIGVFPCAYIQLGTQYPKAGMVAIVSMCVVSLATEIETVPGSVTENFLKRWIAFLIGGIVAIVVEMVLFPVKARTRLVECLVGSLRHITEMEHCIATGIEEGKNLNVFDPTVIRRFERASRKANGTLGAAETFLPFCTKEPRFKGSFDELAGIYSEIIFVLRQITDRMDNMLQLRTAYGSGPLEELNAQIFPYRRNVAGSVVLTLFAVSGALTTKLPLPQFFPSARLAHLRMINRIREVVQRSASDENGEQAASKLARHRVVRRKYMSWNASSAAQAEVIEYLEELVDLTKLLVGANEFRSGLLMRPTYEDYAERISSTEEKVKGGKETLDPVEGNEARDELREVPTEASTLTRRRRTATLRRSAGSEGNELPASLRRIQSRKIEASIKRQAASDDWSR